MKTQIPTRAQYLRAQKIVDAYNTEQRCKAYKRYIKFRIALGKYFNTHKVCGKKVTVWQLDDYSEVYGDDNWVINIYEPNMQLKYDGKNDKDIAKICIRYKMKCRINPILYKDYLTKRKQK